VLWAGQAELPRKTRASHAYPSSSLVSPLKNRLACWHAASRPCTHQQGLRARSGWHRLAFGQVPPEWDLYQLGSIPRHLGRGIEPDTGSIPRILRRDSRQAPKLTGDPAGPPPRPPEAPRGLARCPRGPRRDRAPRRELRGSPLRDGHLGWRKDPVGSRNPAPSAEAAPAAEAVARDPAGPLPAGALRDPAHTPGYRGRRAGGPASAALAGPAGHGGLRPWPAWLAVGPFGGRRTKPEEGGP